MSKKIEHILIIRLSAMGDVAMTVPVIRELRKTYPDIKITILTRTFFKSFFRDIDNVSIHEADVKGKHKGVLGLFKLSRELKSLKIDAVADLHNVLRSNILKILLLGKPFKQIDKGRTQKKALTTGKYFKQLKTTHERYVDVFKDLELELNIMSPKFPKKINLPDSLTDIIGEPLKGYIGIAPFAAFKSKVYPIDLME